ncbi:hypothetical protein Ccrd_005417 [Cynara cardunculus var. scolymus]|uniref:Uncharacterized protein n=1 Tax=Cynara cardunculus var. scolymus TaxID=59895 RepID=A0A103XKN4_CYNCS|nr:hypothetical protein Ccrd_005417 [Cynara cardunculus var. scolymus]
MLFSSLVVFSRGYCHDVEALHLKVVALCALFCLSAFGPCTMTGTHNPVGYDEYGSYRNDLNSGSEDVLIGDGRKRTAPQSSIPKLNLENICKRSDLFCFPSTLSGFFADYRSSEANVSGFSEVKADETVNLGSTEAKNNLSWSSDSGNFRLLSGSVVSCSLELKEIDNSDQNDTPSCKRSSLDWKTSGVNQKQESVRIKSSHMDDFSSLRVQVSHPLLDWGQKYLHFPSLAFLTVENRHNHSVLNIFEPYSTDAQFYPCNYSEIKLGPGEVASICFVFLPKSLGFSSAHLILQTSLGGFLIQAQGFAVESPYVIRSSVGLNYSSNGKWSNIVSLFNPSDKVLHLKEVIAWISFSSGSIAYSVKANCSQIDHKGSSEFSVKEWLNVKIGEIGQPVMAIRPQKTWTVGSNSNEPILELEFPDRSQANIFASFCGQLLNGSRDNLDAIILEAEIGGKSGFYDLKTLSISLGVLIPCDANGTTTVSLLLRNNGPGLLTVVKIRAVGENSESLQIKYVEGLMLFPHSVTQVAMVTFTPDSHVNLNCKLVVETNKSDGPALEISCSDIASLCSRSHSYAGHGHDNGALNYDNLETRSNNVHVQSPIEIKATEMTKADEPVLGNWQSQGTENGMSVLDDDEIIFPLVHVGSHQSKWISVLNPSDQPVVMQLLLNSGEIIDECRGSDEVLQPPSSYTLVLNGYTTPSRYGFSVAGNAVTEAYVHPHGKAVLGPIVFCPSSRCAWRSSVLIRNNLSGVEWLSLRGSGGLLSLLLLDGSDPVRNIKLKHNLPSSINRMMKVVFAKNTGDLPLEVNRISVSGTKCGSDGFLVDSCDGFSLQPGELRKLVISYRADFCAAIVRRELELVMAGGMLIVPMEVSLSTPMLRICKQSLIWTRFKKFFLAILVSILLISMASSCSFSFTIRDENLSKSEEHSSDVCPKPEPETGKEVTSSSLSSSSLAKSMVVEASKPENLTVKTGKEKARRRKKKRGSGSGLTGQFEVLSSQSSNSTPSSPLSPASSSTPKRSPELSPNVRVRSPFKNSVALPPQDKPLAPAKTIGPRARAPGAERKAVKPEEGSRSEDRFTYNIWDDHLQLRFLVPGSGSGSSLEVCVMPTITEDNNFGSLFDVSPQELFKSVTETVGFKQDD